MKINTTETKSGKGRRVLLAAFFMLLLAMLGTTSVFAAEAGWKQTGTSIYYYAEQEDGVVAKVSGFQKIGSRYYFFNASGKMMTGWVATEEGFRYFRPTGGVGVKGRMYTGFKTIGKYKYYFDKQGLPATGFTKLTKNTYYFNTSKKIGTRGRAIVNKWKTIDGVKYYFGSTGAMQKNTWIGKTYYVGEDGALLTNAVTPDRYLVGSDGKKVSDTKINGWVKINGKWYYYDVNKKDILKSKWKTINGNRFYLGADGVRVTGWQKIGSYTYYFSSKGVAATGWKTVSGKRYYFSDKGRMAVNTTLGGYVIGADGVAVKEDTTTDKEDETDKTDTTTSKKKILIIAGHGQGDSGATSGFGYESNYTRQFAKLIYDNLKANGKVDVTYYKNGSTSYDCYQQVAKTLGSSGLNIAKNITGNGSVKSKALSGIKTNSNIPVFTDYDYVLEVHFNATATSAKDPSGDGSYKGCGFYINSYKKTYKVETNILTKMVAAGFKRWGGGVYASATLMNARLCQELGVSYGLLETAFIDDKDDMTFYNSHKTQLAKAVVSAIEANYGA